MSGLVGYGSSDEDGIVGDTRQTNPETSQQADNASPASRRRGGEPAPARSIAHRLHAHLEPATNGLPTPDAPEPPDRASSSPRPPNGHTQGPPKEPSIGPRRTGTPSPPTTTPSSPYTHTRTAIRTLTLPPHPNLSIPPSPPGSPPPGSTQKLTRFLSLKQQGVHFNGKLASSSALKNPSLLPKLMLSAGLAADGAQYATTLPRAVWDPSGFAEGVFKEGLAKSQLEIGKRREGERARGGREGVEFVAAGGAEGPGRGVGTSAVGRGKGSAAERVMAGLERGERAVVRGEMERRGGRDGVGSRSPKRG